MSTEPQKTEDKRLQHTERPLPTAFKRLNVAAPVPKFQDLEPVMEHERVISSPANVVKRVTVTTDLAHKRNSPPDDTPTLGKRLPDEPAATVSSSKVEKVSKKRVLSRKQLVNERIRQKAISAVSAYPTQRPPRKRTARKSNTINESSQVEELRSEERDSEQVPMARPPTLERSDNNEHEENAPEQCLIAEGSLPKDHTSLDSSSEGYAESGFHTPEESFNQGHITSDVGLHARNVLDGEELIESSSEGHEQSRFYTPEESFDENQITANVELSSSEFSDGEDPSTTTDQPVAVALSTRPRKELGSGARGLLWAYATSRTVDEALTRVGIYLWRKPSSYFYPQRLQRIESVGYTALAPVIVSHERTETDEPIIEFDGKTVHIVPHRQYWEDIRSHEAHPDFLVPWKLAEYQACEAAGYQIWRHDKNLLDCRKPGCGARVSDYHCCAIVCLGCGPKSIVRYCSLQHQLEDIRGHWRECGTWKMLLERVIDHTTAPSKFARMFPAIKQNKESRTAAWHRQRLFCALTYGHYTLFQPSSNRSETLCWPKQDPKWLEMDRRIERLLNVTLFDSWNDVILGYLYRLLRELLRSQGEWFESTERLLKQQLESEFSSYKVNTYWRNGEAPCQCEWSGKIYPRWDHLSTCWAYAPVADDCGSARRQKCIEATVEEYEAKFWILRAWRQQHPTQNNWRLRAAGYGFPKVIPDEGCYKLGAGWTGWGGERDNICEAQWRWEERYSTRSA